MDRAAGGLLQVIRPQRPVQWYEGEQLVPDEDPRWNLIAHVRVAQRRRGRAGPERDEPAPELVLAVPGPGRRAVQAHGIDGAGCGSVTTAKAA